MDEFSIFVGTVTDPTQGQWFSVPIDEDEVIEILEEKYGVQPGQEIMISDYEVPSGIDVDPYGSVEQLNEIAEDWDLLDDWAKENFEEISSYFGGNNEETIEKLANDNFNYINVSDDEELGENILDEEYPNVSQELEFYIDVEALGRDRRLNQGGVFIGDRYIY